MTGLPLFRGDGSEDADQWLREIAFATSNCNDSGAFRILSSHLQGDSPAREWYDQLDDSFKSSWSPFERVFRSRWIISTPVPNPTDVAWEKFCKHRLSYEALLNTPSSPPTDATPPSDICPTISTWAEEHLILGKATDREDQSLIDMSKALLPPFIQAHIEVSHQPQPSNFEEFCAAIGQIPSAVADLERVRRRLSSEDWQVRIEQRIQDIAEKVDKLLRCGMQVINSFAAEISAESNQTEPLPNDSAESIAWEPSSPLTSVVSQPNDAVSEPSTPLARTGNLPDAIECMYPFCLLTRGRLTQIQLCL
ncbi:hypothetical protein FRC02_008349 [Tulasnella sp. 418]|nr:hypothetical protein FRC02_008349 [Tulasnella sp. 418]